MLIFACSDPVLCPKCGYAMSTVGNLVANEGPKDGDLVICGGCVTVLRFAADTEKLEVVPEAELAAMTPNNRAVLARVQAQMTEALAGGRPAS